MRKEEEDKGGRKRWGWLVGWLGRWLVGWRGKETGGGMPGFQGRKTARK